jgi:outer membrane protein assembly factor BamB
MKLRAAGLLMIAALADRASADPSTDGYWPGWRGASGQGVSEETRLPLEWSATKNVRWKSEIPGRGYSSPAVWGKRIFLTTDIEGDVVPGAKAVVHFDEGEEFVHPDGVGADRKHTFKVVALDADTGKLVWERTAWEGTPYDSRHKRGAYAAPTPVTDGKSVFVSFGGEGLYAYDFSGKPLWKVALGGIATMGVGYGISPLLHGDLLIVQCDEDAGDKSFVAAFDKRTGREVWRTPRKVQVSWATPILVKSGRRDELVTAGAEHVIAYEPATGKELWRMKGLESNAVPSPVAGDGLVVVSSGYPAKVAIAVRPGGAGDVTDSAQVLWKYSKGTAYVPSPIFYGGYVYLLTDKGLITCLDARTGEVKYEGARPPVGTSVMASPVAYDGKLLLVSMDGDAIVVKSGPSFEILKTNPMGEPIAASPAIAKGRLYIRGEKSLFCIEAAKS